MCKLVIDTFRLWFVTCGLCFAWLVCYLRLWLMGLVFCLACLLLAAVVCLSASLKFCFVCWKLMGTLSITPPLYNWAAAFVIIVELSVQSSFVQLALFALVRLWTCYLQRILLLLYIALCPIFFCAIRTFEIVTLLPCENLTVDDYVTGPACVVLVYLQLALGAWTNGWQSDIYITLQPSYPSLTWWVHYFEKIRRWRLIVNPSLLCGITCLCLYLLLVVLLVLCWDVLTRRALEPKCKPSPAYVGMCWPDVLFSRYLFLLVQMVY